MRNIDFYALSLGSTDLIKNSLLLDDVLIGMNDIRAALPDLNGEDQWLHDSIALSGTLAFSSKVLSYWDGAVSGQLTARNSKVPIFPHVILISDFYLQDL